MTLRTTRRQLGNLFPLTLRTTRRRLGLNMAQMAARLGVGLRAYYLMERGVANTNESPKPLQKLPVSA